MTASWKQHIRLSPMARVIPSRVRKIQSTKFHWGALSWARLELELALKLFGKGLQVPGFGIFEGAMTATGPIVIIVQISARDFPNISLMRAGWAALVLSMR